MADLLAARKAENWVVVLAESWVNHLADYLVVGRVAELADWKVANWVD